MSNISFDENVICPFCAYKDKIQNFRVKLESGGYSRKTYQCVDCGQIMRKNTLTRKISAYQWGEWLYSSIRVWSGDKGSFYHRISWERLKDRVKELGIANDFWNGFKDAKNNYTSRDFDKIVDNAYKPDLIQNKLDTLIENQILNELFENEGRSKRKSC